MLLYSAAGTFQSLPGQSSCLVCPAGSVSQYVAALQGLVGPTYCTDWYDIIKVQFDVKLLLKNMIFFAVCFLIFLRVFIVPQSYRCKHAFG